MGLIIILRRNTRPNYFRNIIEQLLNSKIGDEAIIGSGFFQEDLKFSASKTTNLANLLYQNNIKVTVIGVYNNYWQSAFNKFVTELIINKVQVNNVIRKHRWHAKVFILKKKNIPIVGIIGSSNMTRAAFDYSAPFNYEADVVMWIGGNLVSKTIKKVTQGKEQDNLGIIIAKYNKADNEGITIKQRLIQLINDIEK